MTDDGDWWDNCCPYCGQVTPLAKVLRDKQYQFDHYIHDYFELRDDYKELHKIADEMLYALTMAQRTGCLSKQTVAYHKERFESVKVLENE